VRDGVRHLARWSELMSANRLNRARHARKCKGALAVEKKLFSPLICHAFSPRRWRMAADEVA
jgi:hypothetical protein